MMEPRMPIIKHNANRITSVIKANVGMCIVPMIYYLIHNWAPVIGGEMLIARVEVFVLVGLQMDHGMSHFPILMAKSITYHLV